MLKEEKNTSLIGTLLRDAQQWSDFRSLLKIHVRKAKDLVKEFQEKRILYEEVDDQESPLEAGSGETTTLIDESAERSTGEEKKKKKKKKDHKEKKNRKVKKETRADIQKLLEMIAKMKSDCKDEIKKLERRTKEMIELVSVISGCLIGVLLTYLGFRNLTWFPFSKRVFPHQQLLA